MKLAKKITVFLAAAITAVSVAVPLGVMADSALSWHGKDPNMDGKHGIADATFILQCLFGAYQPTDVDQLDVTDNGIVSQADVDYVQILDAYGIN